MDFGEALERFAQADPEETKEEAAKGQALRLVQREEGGASFLVYATDRGIKTELRFEGEQPWFTTRQLAEIFGVDTDTVSDHVNKFLADGELDEAATTGNFPVVQTEGGRQVTRQNVKHFGLDVAFYVGYRVNSSQGALFRRWATNILIQIAKHGYYMDVERLKEPRAEGVIDKVRSELYEVRAGSTNAYREVRRIVQQPVRSFRPRVIGFYQTDKLMLAVAHLPVDGGLGHVAAGGEGLLFDLVLAGVVASGALNERDAIWAQAREQVAKVRVRRRRPPFVTPYWR